MNKSSPSSPPPTLHADDGLGAVAAGIDGLDRERVTAYEGLANLRGVQQRTLERREKLYLRKYGADDPRVAQARKQGGANTRLRGEIDVALSQAATPAPAVDAHSFVLHGFVRDQQRQAQPGLSVALYDDQGRWFREAGYGCTDDRGHFVLRYASPSAVEPPVAPAAAPRAPDKSPELPVTPAAKPGAAPIAGAVARTFEARVYNSDQKLLHREARPVTIDLGRVEFREIVLDGDGGCTPPPDGPDDPPPGRGRKGLAAALIAGATAAVFKCQSQ